MSDKQNINNESGYGSFCTHASLVSVVNEQRDVLYYNFDGHPEVFNTLLKENNTLRKNIIGLMLDDAFDHHPIVLREEEEEELAYIERVLDLAEVQSNEQFGELTKLLWIHWTSDDEKESENAKERIEKEYLNPGMKYAFVLTDDSRGLDAEGLTLLERYVSDKYNEFSELVFIEDDIIMDPSYLAGKIAGEHQFMGNIHGASDCYVFILHNDKHSMECITGEEYLFSLAKTLLSNRNEHSWRIVMHYVMGVGIEPVSIDDLREEYSEVN